MRRALLLAAAAAAVVAWTTAAIAPCVDAGEPGAEAGPALRAAKKRVRKPKPLIVKRITPRRGARFVDLGVQVKIRFSGPVDTATLVSPNLVFRRLLGDPVDALLEVDATGRTATLTPRKPLEPGTDYEVIVRRGGVARSDGGLLRREKRSIFYTDNRFSPYPILRPDQFTEVADVMHEPRAAHSATLMEGGRVLLAGGESDQYGTLCQAADTFDPDADEFQLTASPLLQPRSYHAAVRRGLYGAMIIGGWVGSGATASTEAWDFSTSAFRSTAWMTEQRDFHAAVELLDGRVLVTGGLRYVSSGAAVYSDTAEILGFDGVWRRTLSNPVRRRAGHTLTVLADGRVLVVGGVSPQSGWAPSAEIFDPADQTFTTVANPPRDYRQLGTATLIDGGTRVLCADGGDAIVEVFDPADGVFHQASGSSFSNRTRATAALLPSGDVLFAGGFDSRGDGTTLLQSMDLYVRSAGDWGRVFYASVVFKEGRAAHTATSLLDGRVLFAGGFSDNGVNLDTAVLFTPDPPEDPPAKR